MGGGGGKDREKYGTGAKKEGEGRQKKREKSGFFQITSWLRNFPENKHIYSAEVC